MGSRRAEPTFEAEVLRTVLASMLIARGRGKLATRRCRRRKVRAMKALTNGAAGRDDMDVTAAALEWLHHECDVCVGCKGVRVTPPPLPDAG